MPTMRRNSRYRTYDRLRIFCAARAEAELAQLRLGVVAEGVQAGFGGLESETR